MKILFIGDSIVKGKLGVSFVDMIAKRFPLAKITNLGVNGENLNIISKRLLLQLKKVNDYDYVVFEGGGGDVFLPHFLEKGKLFEFAHWVQTKKGMVPNTTKAAFYSAYKATIVEAKKLHKGKIILLTYGCLNENLDFKLNAKLEEYNNAIRQIAEEENVLLADAGARMVDYLKDKPQTDHCLESFWTVTYSDPFITFFKGGASYLSKKRKLLVTIDGVHLNDRGAGFYYECIKDVLEKDLNHSN